MTINEAIRALDEAREELGGDAPLLMADGLPVRRLPFDRDCVNGAVYVSDLPPEPEDDEDPEEDRRLIDRAAQHYVGEAPGRDCPGGTSTVTWERGVATVTLANVHGTLARYRYDQHTDRLSPLAA
jgi:hypothetical protein